MRCVKLRVPSRELCGLRRVALFLCVPARAKSETIIYNALPAGRLINPRWANETLARLAGALPSKRLFDYSSSPFFPLPSFLFYDSASRPSEKRVAKARKARHHPGWCNPWGLPRRPRAPYPPSPSRSGAGLLSLFCIRPPPPGGG